MPLRLQCLECRTTFLVADDRLGQSVDCPRCLTEQEVPSTAQPSAQDASVWIIDENLESNQPEQSKDRSRPDRRLWVSGLVGLVILALIGGGISWYLKEADQGDDQVDPMQANLFDPNDPADVALAFAEAIAQYNPAEAERYSILQPEDWPPIRDPRDLRSSPDDAYVAIEGNFGPIAEFHQQIDQDYRWNEQTGFYEVRDPLKPATRLLDASQEAEKRGEGQRIADLINSPDPDDLFDAAEALAKLQMNLGEVLLEDGGPTPSYRRLIEQADPVLPDSAEQMVLFYDQHDERVDTLLKRDFKTLNTKGTFTLVQTQARLTATPAGFSVSQEPLQLRLTLTRFRLNSNDTGWKVTAIDLVEDEGPLTSPGQPEQTQDVPSSTSSR